MTQYIAERGVEETIRQIATRGPLAILADLGPGPGECKRIVAESSRLVFDSIYGYAEAQI